MNEINYHYYFFSTFNLLYTKLKTPKHDGKVWCLSFQFTSLKTKSLAGSHKKKETSKDYGFILTVMTTTDMTVVPTSIHSLVLYSLKVSGKKNGGE